MGSLPELTTAQQVFGISELLEMILLHASHNDASIILRCRQLNHFSKSLIHVSTPLQQALLALIHKHSMPATMYQSNNGIPVNDANGSRILVEQAVDKDSDLLITLKLHTPAVPQSLRMSQPRNRGSWADIQVGVKGKAVKVRVRRYWECRTAAGYRRVDRSTVEEFVDGSVRLRNLVDI